MISETSEKLAKPSVGNFAQPVADDQLLFFLFFLAKYDKSLEIAVFDLLSDFSCARRILNFVSLLTI